MTMLKLEMVSQFPVYTLEFDFGKKRRVVPKFPKVRNAQLLAILPLAVVHTLGNLFTNMSLGMVVVSFTHTIKAMGPFFFCPLFSHVYGRGTLSYLSYVLFLYATLVLEIDNMHGASVVIKAGDRGIYSEIWVEQLLNMYISWAEKKGEKGRVVDMYSSRGGGIKSATIEFEFEFAYGYLMGERGVHRMMGSINGSTPQEASLAAVDVIPLFLDTVSNLTLDDKDVIVSYTPSIGTGKFLKHTKYIIQR